MKLSTMERNILTEIIPEKGNFTNLKLIRTAREALSFTDEENKLLNVRVVAGNVVWNNSVWCYKDSDVRVEGSDAEIKALVEENPDNYELKPAVEDCEIELGDTVTNMIVEALKELNTKEELTMRYFSLYEKFIEQPLKEAALEESTTD